MFEIFHYKNIGKIKSKGSMLILSIEFYSHDYTSTLQDTLFLVTCFINLLVFIDDTAMVISGKIKYSLNPWELLLDLLYRDDGGVFILGDIKRNRKVSKILKSSIQF